MSENNMKDCEFVLMESSEYVTPAEEAPAERIGDFIVRGGDEVVKYVGTDMVVVIPEGITKIDSFFLEGKQVTEVRLSSTAIEISFNAENSRRWRLYVLFDLGANGRDYSTLRCGAWQESLYV